MLRLWRARTRARGEGFLGWYLLPDQPPSWDRIRQAFECKAAFVSSELSKACLTPSQLCGWSNERYHAKKSLPVAQFGKLNHKKVIIFLNQAMSH